MWQHTVPYIASKLLGDIQLPLSIEVERQPPVCFAEKAEVRLRINSFRGFLALLFPTMGRFAESYVKGNIDKGVHKDNCCKLPIRPVRFST